MNNATVGSTEFQMGEFPTEDAKASGGERVPGAGQFLESKAVPSSSENRSGLPLENFAKTEELFEQRFIQVFQDKFCMGKRAQLVQVGGMSTNAQPDKMALLMAEEVLRRIYGDDLKGCTVSLDSIATVLSEGLKQRDAQNESLFELYDKVVEAVHVLSTPPDPGKIPDPAQLQSLLTERLDAIHTVATKTIETTAFVKVGRGRTGAA